MEEAKQAVKGIKKGQLIEVRSMAAPPQPVRLALESICLLLGEVCQLELIFHLLILHYISLIFCLECWDGLESYTRCYGER